MENKFKVGDRVRREKQYRYIPWINGDDILTVNKLDSFDSIRIKELNTFWFSSYFEKVSAEEELEEVNSQIEELQQRRFELLNPPKTETEPIKAGQYFRCIDESLNGFGDLFLIILIDDLYYLVDLDDFSEENNWGYGCEEAADVFEGNEDGFKRIEVKMEANE
jgi:hypothetical protein